MSTARPRTASIGLLPAVAVNRHDRISFRAAPLTHAENLQEFIAMSLRLDGKNALITGAASGIGRASAIRFAEEGANVAVADRNLAASEETAASVRKLGR